jgi:hypothetical protein
VSLASAGAAAIAGVAGSPYAISAAGALGSGLGNYTISYLPGSFAVTPAALTITALDQSKVYGSTFTFASTEFSSAGLLNGDAVSSVSLASAGAAAIAGVAGSPYAISAAGALGSGLGNYTISYLPGNFAVTPAALTITALDQSKVYGSTFTFAGTEFSASGLKNGESVGLANFSSAGAAATAGVAGGPYAITISNPHGGSFDPANYTISFFDGALSVTPAALLITASDQRKAAGQTLVFDGTKFMVSGLKNGETIGLVALSSEGAPASARKGSYSITAADASGGTYDPSNYSVVYADGTLVVFGSPPAPLPENRPPPSGPILSQEELQRLLAQLDENNLTPESASDKAADEASVISSSGIQHLNVNTFFGEQLVEPGGAMMIDASGLGPLLPIGEGPQNLENELAEKPHELLEAAIAEDDRKRNVGEKARYYEVSPDEVLTADEPGEVGFEQLRRGPAVLQRAIDENTERRLLRAAGL